jgi:hypothetical protein
VKEARLAVVDLTLLKKSNFACRKKSCQKGSGVYCAISASLLVEKRIAVVGKEIVARAERVPSIFYISSSPPIGDPKPRGIANPDGTHEMNDSANGSPSADDRVTLRESV